MFKLISIKFVSLDSTELPFQIMQAASNRIVHKRF
jgi:hypothetical protein